MPLPTHTDERLVEVMRSPAATMKPMIEPTGRLAMAGSTEAPAEPIEGGTQ